MNFDNLQIFWFLLFIFQISISYYFYTLYKKDKDKRKLIFSIGFLFVSYSHIYEIIIPSIFGGTPLIFTTSIQYWSFYPLIFAYAAAIHNRLIQSINSNLLFKIFLILSIISFPLITINPTFSSNYIGIIGLLIAFYLIIACFYNSVKSKNITDILFLFSIASYMTGAAGLLGFIPVSLAIFGFFTANSYIIIIFVIPFSNKKTSYIKNYVNIQKELESTKAALNEREQSFQTLFNQLADPVMILDKKGKFIELTDRVKEYTGFEKSEILGKNFLTTKLLTSKSKRICIKNLMKRMAGIHVGPYEVEALTKEGNIIPFEVNAQKIVYQGKNADLVIFRDISERKKAEQQVRESEERYRTIFDQSGEGVFIHDLDGNILDVNKKMTEIFGYTKDEFKQLNVMQIHSDYALENGKKSFDKVLKTGEVRFDSDFIKKDQTIFSGEITSSIVAIGGRKYIQGTLRDISERKESERKLKEAHLKLREMNNTLEQKVQERTVEVSHLLKQKDDFINQLGHDLKNPIGPLLQLLPIIRNSETDEKKKEMIDVMIRNVGYMKNLVVKTIELAKLNSPNTHFHYQSINLSEIIQQTLESNQLLFNEKSIDINCNLSRDIFINADQLRIEELLNNLLNNAVKYSDRNGSIIIDALESNGMVTISLKDTGIGMTKDQIEHIFDEFYKADTSRHDFDSSGLGMPIAKRIVEKHGGRIWVESEGIDKGSTFYFSLPIELNNQINNGKSYDDITSSIDNLFKN